MTQYVPEIGEAIFGNPHLELEVPIEVEEAIDCIRCAISVFYPKKPSPFSNTAARMKFPRFEVIAYDWSAAGTDEGQQWNFKWKDFEISWYKYWGRGLSRNRKISRLEIEDMVRECLQDVMSGEGVDGYTGEVLK